jgi:hypothetical protein
MEDASNISPEVLCNVVVAIAECNIVVGGQGIFELYLTKIWKCTPRSYKFLHFIFSLLLLDYSFL